MRLVKKKKKLLFMDKINSSLMHQLIRTIWCVNQSNCILCNFSDTKDKVEESFFFYAFYAYDC